MTITIGWQSQQSWRGYHSHCRDHRWLTGVRGLEEMEMPACYNHVGKEQDLVALQASI